MLIIFAESGHLAFRGTSALSRGPLKSEGGGETSIHCNAEPTTAEQLLRIIVRVNQLSVCGAVADWCQDLAQRIKSHSSPCKETPTANVDNAPASRVPSEDVSNLTKSPIWNSGARGNLVREIHLPEDLELTEACDDAGFMRNVFRGQLFITLPTFIWQGMVQHAHAQNIRILEVTEDSNRKDLFEAIPKLVHTGCEDYKTISPSWN